MPLGKIRGNSLSLADHTLILSTIVSHAIPFMTKKLRNISYLDATCKQTQLLASSLVFILVVLSPDLWCITDSYWRLQDLSEDGRSCSRPIVPATERAARESFPVV